MKVAMRAMRNAGECKGNKERRTLFWDTADRGRRRAHLRFAVITAMVEASKVTKAFRWAMS